MGAAVAKRALAIGSQTGGLQGVDGDVEVTAGALSDHGFTVTRAVGADATLDGIVTRYRQLIADTSAGDCAVVYYSGHGGRQVNALATRRPDLPAYLQYLVPTDFDDRSGGRFRGLLAEQLSLLQRQLTDKTDNVTTILDCCHSARMSRDAAQVPKARIGDPFPWADLERSWRDVLEQSGGAPMGDSNDRAVRLVACSPDQSAFELAETSIGGAHGALTAELVSVLRRPQALELSWGEVLGIIRPAIMGVVPEQRPEVEGIHLGRKLFSTDAKDLTRVLPVVVDNGTAFLDLADLFGASEGDTYALTAPGGDPRSPLASATVELVVANRARLAIDGASAATLPPGTRAHPLVTALGARPVVLTGGTEADRDLVASALAASSQVRLVDQPAGALATVDLAGGIQLLDSAGMPLLAQPRTLTPGSVKLLVRDLERLARAAQLRSLPAGTGQAELPSDVTVAVCRLLISGGEEELPLSGAQLHPGDRVVVRFANTGPATRYVSVLDVGVAGAITVLNSSEPDGVTVAAGKGYELGRDPSGPLSGIELFWPDGVPPQPRPETMLIIVSDAKVSGLGLLSQGGVASTARGAHSSLEQLVEDVAVGRRDARVTPSGPAVRYTVTPFNFVFQPADRPDEVAEPAFELDARPDPSFRLVTPLPRGQGPTRVAVRLTDVTVHANHSWLKANVRVDALVVTAAGDGADPYRAASAHFSGIGDRQRLPLDQMLVFEGPVARFVDLAIWITRDNRPDTDLAGLLRQQATPELAGAVTVLAGLAVAAPPAAAVAGAMAAVGTVVKVASAVLGQVEGDSIRVYRTSLLPHESFGAAPDGRRHPESGVIRAQDMSFAYEIVDVSAP